MNIILYIVLIVILIILIFEIYYIINKHLKNKIIKNESFYGASLDQITQEADGNLFSDLEKSTNEEIVPDEEYLNDIPLENKDIYGNVVDGNIRKPPLLVSFYPESSKTQLYTDNESNINIYSSKIYNNIIKPLKNRRKYYDSNGNRIDKNIEEELIVEEEFNIYDMVNSEYVFDTESIEEECCERPVYNLHPKVCTKHYDVCRVDEEGNDSCCDGYTCTRPMGNFGVKKCLNSGDKGFPYKAPDIDATGYYDISIPYSDYSEMRIPKIDISNIHWPKGFSDFGLSKLNPAKFVTNLFTCKTKKHTCNQLTGEIKSNS